MADVELSSVVEDFIAILQDTAGELAEIRAEVEGIGRFEDRPEEYAQLSRWLDLSQQLSRVSQRINAYRASSPMAEQVWEPLRQACDATIERYFQEWPPAARACLTNRSAVDSVDLLGL